MAGAIPFFFSLGEQLNS